MQQKFVNKDHLVHLQNSCRVMELSTAVSPVNLAGDLLSIAL